MLPILAIDAMWVCLPIIIIGAFFFLFGSVKMVRPTERVVIERLGKYHRTAESGLLVVIPFFEHSITVPVTEIRVDVEKQTVITKDNLNTDVDAIVYYRIQDVVKALYQIDNYKTAIPSLAQTTLRAVMGRLNLSEANENRQKINASLEEELDRETNQWGIDIMRVELQRIQPPNDVQQAMNNVVKAENEKIAAINLATAVETRADGEKRAAIKVAEGHARATELEAEAKAKSIQLVNEAAQKYFRGEAQNLKKLEVAEKVLSENTKFIIPEGKELSLVISEAAGTEIIPVKKN
jgi:regulator of protease activity HflC (stomatin/prohibitin superfamily)